jgi:hypothetical protein
MSDETTARLADISERLEQAASRLRSGELDGDEARQLAGECAELAQQAAAELERVARFDGPEAAPGQEELL